MAQAHNDVVQKLLRKVRKGTRLIYILGIPSLTDTYGIVLLEALASGLPIAAYPVTGPLDVIDHSGCGVLSWDLREAALAALEIPRERCRVYGETFTWR